MDLSLVRSVLFDAVGTLIYADPPVPQVYVEAGRRHGSGLTAEDVSGRFAVAFQRHALHGRCSEHLECARWRKVVADVFMDVPDTTSLFQELWDHFAEPGHWSLYDDVKESWRAIQAAGYNVGIASNFDQRLTRIVAELSPLHTSQVIFTSAQIGFSKPSAEFFHAVSRSLELSPRQLLLVGDDADCDWRGARDAGWNSLLLRRDSDETEPSILRSLKELPRRLR